MFASQRLGLIRFEAASPAALELKVGLIKECNRHPDADKLYVSQIITSEAEDATTLTVCSGLVNFISREDLLNKKVVLLTNLKPSKMRGIKSEAMILASEDSEATKVEVVNPPISSELGDLLHFKPFIPEKKPSRLKSKIWEEVQSKLFTDSEGKVVFKSEDQEYRLSGSKSDDFAFVETLRNTIVR
ncbi:Phenylalanyl-tRNA synthetase beta chain [Wickerhamomyces ciferrii]|uniref:Phenylalanyl-tRNA synthetase beta chain n=1 Tax=Wickerhamomyces ciferrii (strain ATCC 14091 / BCRC 22168 / CBS 111 / JCM 3599 / NBRC 0793 / NRRL Y-1031 F-60-10) TaxID=1206466 RepID=K0KKG9_WICCF|nr:Phenylalanyl-tRNA synthetase beta chain [Wickerhamomyces ciferrii]CCH45705.1 Phenylalanyl-tRNA synthetase beta chain [Wickerhamomyces ciferrii]